MNTSEDARVSVGCWSGLFLETGVILIGESLFQVTQSNPRLRGDQQELT